MTAKINAVFILLVLLFIEGCDRMPTPNYQKMVLPKTSNYFLACPPKYCNVVPNVYSPVYSVSGEDLFNAFNHIIAEDPQTVFIYNMPEQGQFELLSRAEIFNLPQDISVQFIALSDNASTLAVYSKSRYGFYDFGGNKRRIETWLEKLAVKTQQKSHQASK